MCKEKRLIRFKFFLAYSKINIKALPRNEPKDIADILFFCRKYTFDWKTIIGQAQAKEMWVRPIEVSKLINEFHVPLFSQLNWIEAIVYEWAHKDLKKIAFDIIVQPNNTLIEKKAD